MREGALFMKRERLPPDDAREWINSQREAVWAHARAIDTEVYLEDLCLMHSRPRRSMHFQSGIHTPPRDIRHIHELTKNCSNA